MTLTMTGVRGGPEAEAFVELLAAMYTAFAVSQGWRFELVRDLDRIVLRVEGAEAYRLLQHETGVHRFQRVPPTDRQGRVHTSEAIVSVFAGDHGVTLSAPIQRIRTYNVPQNRLTDHRADLTLYDLQRVLAGELAPVLSRR